MYLLRRTAARAICSAPSKTLFVKPRSIATYAPALRIKQQQWIATSINRRFVSDDASKVEAAESAATSREDFAQTAQEPPVEEDITPAIEATQAPSTGASTTAGTEAVDAIGATDPDSTSRTKSFQKGPQAPSNVLYVGNLYYEVTEDSLKRVFSRFGAVDKVKIVLDPRGLSRGFAYVEYENVDDAQSAVDNLDMQVFEGRNLVVQFRTAKPNRNSPSDQYPSRREPTKTLFIGNMSFEMSDKDLNDLFRDIRNVLDVRVAIDRRTGQPRGFAHADFVDIEGATKAREMLQGKVFHGRALRVDFARSGTVPEARPE